MFAWFKFVWSLWFIVGALFLAYIAVELLFAMFPAILTFFFIAALIRGVAK